MFEDCLIRIAYVEEILYYSANIKFSNRCTTYAHVNSNSASMYNWEKGWNLIWILLKWAFRLDSYNISVSGEGGMVDLYLWLFMDYGAEFPLRTMLKQKDMFSLFAVSLIFKTGRASVTLLWFCMSTKIIVRHFWKNRCGNWIQKCKLLPYAGWQCHE